MTNGREVIPSLWNYRKISEVTTKVGSGSTPRGGESVYQDSGVPLIRSMNVHSSGFKSDGLAFIDADEARKLDHVIVQPSDVLLNITGASIGRVTTAPNALAGARVNQHVCIIRPKEELSSSFLSFFLASPNEQARVMNVQVGATRQALTKAMVLDWDVPVPPFHEQQEIVAEIEKQFSRLDEAVANLKRVKANLKRYKASVLKAAVEGALVPIKNRQTTKIGEVADLVTKGSSPNWQGFTYADSGVVFVRSQNVGWGNLDLSDIAHLPPAFNEKERKSVLRTGDVLLNIVGASIGRAAVATPEIEGGNVNQAVAVIRLNKERMLPKYLMLNLLSPGTQAAIHTEKVDVARANVSLSDIKVFSILCPSLAEQGMMVAEVELRLSVIEELQGSVEASLARADRLRQSILKRAFEGKLIPTKQPQRSDSYHELPLAAESSSPYGVTR
ncbi:MAG: hypothetical protein E8D42_04835 [Nitrospira sp.]|nr:MAG: hypothetical protein E8D42_04835 [Nitrospira sp.]